MQLLYTIACILLCAFHLTAQPRSAETSNHQKAFLFGYQGFKGNSLSISFGKSKTCNYCEERNVKFMGAGLELGLNIQDKPFVGSKLIAERGRGLIGIRGTLMLLTSNFKTFGYIVRPELIWYMTKNQLLSIGLGYNLGANFNDNKLLLGAIQFNVGYLLR